MPEGFEFDVFISYAHADAERIRPIAERLKSEGFTVWIDEIEIQAGDSIPHKIEQGLQKSHKKIVCMSSNYFASNWTTYERLSAFMKDPLNLSRQVIPLLLDEYEIPEPFSQFKYLDFKSPNESKYQQLLKSISTKETKLGTPKTAKTSHPKAWNPPRTPDPFIGREKDLNRIKAALGISFEAPIVRSKIISVHGIPGVGKSTFAAWLANDPDVLRAYPDAVLWSAFGQFNYSSDSDFEIRERLRSWGSFLGDKYLLPAMLINEMTDRLATMLRNRRALLICDDVWDVNHISAIRSLADGDVRLLITSRLTDVAAKVVSYRDGVMELKVFAESDAISLLKILAPAVVEKYPDESRSLLRDLEYLPLAINVAGHLLRREMDAGLDVVTLIEELRQEGEQLLKEAPPVDMMELIREAKSPTVTAWLKRSTQMLDANTRRCFISLGYIAPKPATFGLRVLKRRWKGQNVNAVIRKLIDTGLIQTTIDQRYQMHALLVTLARSMSKEISDE